MLSFKRLFLFVLSCAISCVACAQNSDATNSSQREILNYSQASLVKVHCPQINQLVLNPDTRIWSYGKFWKSYNSSLTKVVDTFLGAQWSGSTIGSVICVYGNKKKLGFPVLVYFSGMVRIPTSANWIASKRGYKNCKKSDPLECPFFAYTPSNKKQDYYDEALKLWKKR